jgi:hypothetical protein
MDADPEGCIDGVAGELADFSGRGKKPAAGRRAGITKKNHSPGGPGEWL